MIPIIWVQLDELSQSKHTHIALYPDQKAEGYLHSQRPPLYTFSVTFPTFLSKG